MRTLRVKSGLCAPMEPATHTLTLPGAMLRRGFWLYVWRVVTRSGQELLYVGRTGDNSSPHATAPYIRMGQHLGYSDVQNALRKHLRRRELEPEDCASFEFIAHGPIHPEIDRRTGERADWMATHMPIRDQVGAMEKALAEELSAAGYDVLNTVKWKPPLDPEAWAPVRAAFTEHFSRLGSTAPTDTR